MTRKGPNIKINYILFDILMLLVISFSIFKTKLYLQYKINNKINKIYKNIIYVYIKIILDRMICRKGLD